MTKIPTPHTAKIKLLIQMKNDKKSRIGHFVRVEKCTMISNSKFTYFGISNNYDLDVFIPFSVLNINYLLVCIKYIYIYIYLK